MEQKNGIETDKCMGTKTSRLCRICVNKKDIYRFITSYIVKETCDNCGKIEDVALVILVDREDKSE